MLRHDTASDTTPSPGRGVPIIMDCVASRKQLALTLNYSNHLDIRRYKLRHSSQSCLIISLRTEFMIE